MTTPKNWTQTTPKHSEEPPYRNEYLTKRHYPEDTVWRTGFPGGIDRKPMPMKRLTGEGTVFAGISYDPSDTPYTGKEHLRNLAIDAGYTYNLGVGSLKENPIVTPAIDEVHLLVESLCAATGAEAHFVKLFEAKNHLAHVFTITLEAKNWAGYVVFTGAGESASGQQISTAFIADLFCNDPAIASHVTQKIRELGDPTLLEKSSNRDSVQFEFSWVGTQGPQKRTRSIPTKTWAEIATNYPQVIQGNLESLALNPPDPSLGRMILMHGPPGTGKTTFIRSLCSQWVHDGEVNRVVYPLDANQFFADNTSLMDMILGERTNYPWEMNAPSKGEAPKKDGMLVVLEDASDLCDPAKTESAAVILSKLLNLCDGILGQGLEARFIITTNKNIREMHPALIRDGRCAANLFFAPFSKDEANQWLQEQGSAERVERPVSLSELYALINKQTKIEQMKPKTETGQYL